MQESNIQAGWLTAAELIERYRVGEYPEGYTADGRLIWKKPDFRAILPLDSYKIPRNIRRAARRQEFTIKVDSDFEQVVRGCSRRTNTWISEEIIRVSCALAEQGHAHSVEAWNSDKLVGGTYGVTLGSTWFGESMFHTLPNASKLALAALCNVLVQSGFTLFDTQVLSPTVAQLGAKLVPRETFLELLSASFDRTVTWPAAGSIIEV